MGLCSFNKKQEWGLLHCGREVGLCTLGVKEGRRGVGFCAVDVKEGQRGVGHSTLDVKEGQRVQCSLSSAACLLQRV